MIFIIIFIILGLLLRYDYVYPIRSSLFSIVSGVIVGVCCSSLYTCFADKSVKETIQYPVRTLNTNQPSLIGKDKGGNHILKINDNNTEFHFKKLEPEYTQIITGAKFNKLTEIKYEVKNCSLWFCIVNNVSMGSSYKLYLISKEIVQVPFIFEGRYE